MTDDLRVIVGETFKECVSELPLVSIVISNYNSGEFLRECIASLKKSSYNIFEIIVVDAGSTDGSAQMLRKEFPDVELIQAGRVGIGTATNEGIKKARGEIIVFDLNSDDLVHEDWLLNLVTTVCQHNYGVVACGKRYIYGTNRIDSAGARINRLTGSFPPIGGGELDDSRFDTSYEVDYVPVITTSRKVLEEVGLCDERYEIYFEDADFCYRAVRKGFKVIYLPQAKFYHHGSMTIGKISQKRVYYMLRNRIRFIIKNFPTPFALSSLLLTPLWLISEFLGLYRSVQFGSGGGFSILWKNIDACIDAVRWNVSQLRETLVSRGH